MMDRSSSSGSGRHTAIRALIFAGLCEAACVLGGLLLFFLTAKWIWIVIGLVASLGFSVPAIVRFLRDLKERDRASR